MCREEAHKLWEQAPAFTEMGVGMACVLRENIPGQAEELAAIWKGAIYLDEEMDFFQFVHDGKLATAGVLSLLGSAGSIKRSSTYLRHSGLSSNLKGDGWTLGGLLVVGPGDQVEYRFKESTFGQHAPLDLVMEAAAAAAAKATDGQK